MNTLGLSSDRALYLTDTTSVFKTQDILSPDCRRKKKPAYHKYTQDIAMTDCLIILYPA